MTKVIPAVAILLLAASPFQLRAQSQADPSDPKFAQFVYDVVSIRLNKSDITPRSTETPDGYSFQNLPFQALVTEAYRDGFTQLHGVPSWMSLERYEVEAKMSPGVAEALQALTPADEKLARQHMLQQLAKEYLKLSVHRESKEIPVFELQIAKDGQKLKEVADPKRHDDGFDTYQSGIAIWQGRGTTIARLSQMIEFVVGRPVVNKTGLTGRYEYSLKFSLEGTRMAGITSAEPSAAPTADGPDIRTALNEQLGLKLVPAKGLTNVVVIDHVERPDKN